MAEGCRRGEWSRVGRQMALLANCHRGRNTRAWRAENFDPYLAADLAASRPARMAGESTWEQVTGMDVPREWREW